MLNQATMDMLTAMKMTAMAAEFANQLKDPTFNELGFEERLGLLVNAEWNRRQSNKLNVRLNTKQGVYTRGIAEYDRLGPDDWMETMFNVAYNDNYAFYLGQGAPANTAHEYAISDAKSELIPSYIQRNIYDAADDAVFDDNGKVIANVLPGYDDLDWSDGDSEEDITAAQNVRGFHTLEFLLFKNGNPRTVQ